MVQIANAGEIVDIDEVGIEERNIYHMIVIDPNRKPGSKPVQVQHDAERHSCRQWCVILDIVVIRILKKCTRDCIYFEMLG
jgi:hypothetical protein